MSKKERSWFGFSFFLHSFFFNEMLCYTLAFLVILFYYYYYVCVGYPLKSEEGVGLPRARVTGGFGPLNTGNEN